MVHIRALEVGPIATNCYLVHNEAGKAFIVDAGYEVDLILAAIRDLELTHILITHAHFDHIGGVARLKAETGASVLIHHIEAEWLTDPQLNMSAIRSEFTPWPVEGPSADELLEDGQILSLLGERIEVRHTPGHSPGHVSYVMGDVVFGGDALFYGSIGRTDLPGGDHRTLVRSIRDKLLTLPASTTVLPGHGPPTTVGAERESNPFLV